MIKAARLVAIVVCVHALVVVPSASAAVIDTFDDGDLVGWTVLPAKASWIVDAGAVRHAYTPNGPSELVMDVGRGLGADFAVSASITTSPGRTNAGLTTLFKDHANHMWAKIEISPGHPAGFMTIGRHLAGVNSSLLAKSPVPLLRSTTYRVSLRVTGTVVTWSVFDATGVTLIRSITYSLSAKDQAAFAGATKSGFRTKTLFDEDDGLTRLDDFGLE